MNKEYKPTKLLLDKLKDLKVADPEKEIDWASYSPDIPIKEWLYNEYGISLTDIREQVSYVQAQDEKIRLEEQKKVKEEEQKVIEAFKKEKAKKITIPAFEVFRSYLKTVLESKDIHFLIGIGDGGLGKSFCTINSLKEFTDFNNVAYLNSKTTPLALYQFLYKHKDKVILFDDIIGLLDNDVSVGILMSALWSATKQRIIHYETTAKVFYKLNLPSSFEFMGKIIILTNHLNLKSKYISALQDRGFFWEFNFGYKDKIEIMREIVKVQHEELDKEQRQEVFAFVIAESNPTTKNFSFRALIKAYNLYRYNPNTWKELVKSILKQDDAIAFVWDLMSKKIENAWQVFVDEGYGSRATFFRIKRKLECEV